MEIEYYEDEIWIMNDLYEYLLNHPHQTVAIYETRDEDTLIKIVIALMDVLVLSGKRMISRDYRHNWKLQPMIDCLRHAYKETMESFNKTTNILKTL